MDPLISQALSSIVASGPVAVVLFLMWYFQRRDAREEAARASANLKAEQDRHATEEEKWRLEFVGIMAKFLAAINGKDHP